MRIKRIPEIGSMFLQKKGHTLRITALTDNTDRVMVEDITLQERGSWSVLYSGLVNGAVRSIVAPFNAKSPAYIGIGKYHSKNCDLGYSKWLGMFRRCYIDGNINYKNCKVSEFWWDFQNFAKWFEDNYPKDLSIHWELDKDILTKGNKVYSPENCCFVPRDINTLFTSRINHRGDYPLGVYYKTKNKKFCAQCADGSGGAQVYLGLHNTAEEAFMVYKEFKEATIKKQADKFKDCITKEVYETLYNYQVEWGD
jgi:hypothetical protein